MTVVDLFWCRRLYVTFGGFRLIYLDAVDANPVLRGNKLKSTSCFDRESRIISQCTALEHGEWDWRRKGENERRMQ